MEWGWLLLQVRYVESINEEQNACFGEGIGSSVFIVERHFIGDSISFVYWENHLIIYPRRRGNAIAKGVTTGHCRFIDYMFDTDAITRTG